MKNNCYNSKKCNCNFAPVRELAETYPSANCNMPVRRHLEPVLVARIYNQPIVEELPYSAMSLTVDNMAKISNAYSDIMPLCANVMPAGDDCGCDAGYGDDGNYMY